MISPKDASSIAAVNFRLLNNDADKIQQITTLIERYRRMHAKGPL